jgi:hypothetical protein
MTWIIIGLASVALLGVAYLYWDEWRQEQKRIEAQGKHTETRVAAFVDKMKDYSARSQEPPALPGPTGVRGPDAERKPVSSIPPPSLAAVRAVPARFAKPKVVRTIPPPPKPSAKKPSRDDEDLDEATSMYNPDSQLTSLIGDLGRAIDSAPPLPDPPHHMHATKHDIAARADEPIVGGGGHSGGGGASFTDPEPWPSSHHSDHSTSSGLDASSLFDSTPSSPPDPPSD